ncbi:MAG: divergent PAP2 family protein [Anaerolineaceae bacterium]|nr:divergent PAP2 family protein [Anaerolineaceae bacterium]
MIWNQLIHNYPLLSGLIAWLLAQALKPVVYFLVHRDWHWGLWLSPGGMPSSHSSLMVATTVSIGLFDGFDSAAFAIAVPISMIVIYDAAGVRRQAGFHAQRINYLIKELLAGHQISDVQLKEVIGHSPLEVVGGTILAFAVSISTYFMWR